MAASTSKVIGKNTCESKYDPYLKYDPLPEDHIRLLRMQGGLNTSYSEDEIRISLISAPLSECPPYVTLSYTWADPEPLQDPKTAIFTKVARCFPIKCGGDLVLCTRNLRNALRALRQIQNSQKSATANGAIKELAADFASFNKNIHLYWIDAICINQEDIKERSRQVSLMSRIYGQAQCTMAWLGERDTYTEPAMRVLLKIVGDQIADHSSVRLRNTRSTNTKFEGMQSLTDGEIAALGMLLARQWFSRTWILQEVVLSPTVVTLWGTVYFSFDLLTRAATILSESRSSMHFTGRILRLIKENRLDSSHYDNLGRILGAETALAMIGRGRLYLQNNTKPDFMAVVRMCRASKSSDLRDRIYGILGIAAELDNSSQGDNKPDYSLSVAEVYMRATSVVIRSRSDLACLILTCDESYKQIKSLPSWCPDYSASVLPLREFSDLTRTWQLGLSWPNALSPEIIQTSILRVDGCMVDVVVEISSLTKNRIDHSMHYGLSTVMDLATRLEDEDTSISIARHGHGPFETLWRTVIYDQYYKHAPAPATAAFFVPAFLPWLLSLIYGIEKTGSNESGHVQSLEDYSRGESIFDETKKLESIMNQLEPGKHQKTLGLPSFSRVRKSLIEHLSRKRKPSADDVVDTLQYISTEELRHSYQEHKTGHSAVDLRSLGATSSTPSFNELFNLLMQNFAANWSDGRLERVIFRTKNTLGAGQPSVRVGDEIWLLYGATAPVILRPLPNGNYRFMGEGYVHGIMYGEAGALWDTHKSILIE